MNFEIQVSIYDKPVPEKTPKSKRGQLFDKIRKSKGRSISPSNFAKIITEDKRPFCHATFIDNTNKQTNFVQSQLFALDFDNEEGPYISPRDVLDKCNEIGIARPFFIGSSLSDNTDKNHGNEEKLNVAKRFRVIFLLTEPITDIDSYKWYFNNGIRQIFPQADQGCHATQMWFPCRDTIYLNTDNRLDIVKMISSADLLQVKNKTPGTARKYLKRKYKNIPPNLFGGRREEGESLDDSGYLWDDSGRKKKNVQKVTDSYSNIKEPGRNWTKLIRGFNWGLACNECDLLDRFLNRKGYISHNELKLLYSSMRKIRGGRKKWKECVEGNSDIEDRKLDIAFWFNAVDPDNEWYDFPFSTYAPEEKAGKKYTSLLDIYFLKRGAPAFKHTSPHEIPIGSAEAKLRTSLTSAVDGNENSFHVIKATTGIGKTELAIQLLKKGVVIAVPTHKLKREIFERVERKNIEVSVIPEEPELPKGLSDEIEIIRSTGDFTKAAGILSLIKNNIEKSTEYGDNISHEELIILKRTLEEYFSDIEECLDSSTPIITTHNALIFRDFPEHDTVIIDEDIIPTLMETKSVYEKDLRLLRSEIKSLDDPKSRELFEVLDDIYMKIENCELGRVYKNFWTLDDDQYELLRSAVFKLRSRFSGAPILLFASSYYIVELEDRMDEKGKRIVHFFDRKSLPEDKKYILSSATASQSMYEKLFKNVKWTDISNVAHTGNRIQFSDLSNSRSTIGCRNNEWVIDAVNKNFNNTPVITFQTHRNLFDDSVEYYFGNIQGYDSLKGQDIAVIGTDHKPEYLYKLMAKELKVDHCHEDFDLADQLVDYNGYTFYFKSYSNPDLRMIQFYYIESSLTQACGRNRGLREDATCYLFSNFPLPGFEQRSTKELKPK